MTSDLDLVRQFAQENSQDAFGEIVRRHLNLVYSASLRQVRSPQLAEDVAQSVFADLARDARKLKPDTILTAWLYAVARRTAIDTVRKESRRQLREQIAVEMNAMNATANDWEQIAPLLDDAMAALDETDRAAVLLRYFENKSLRDVGESLKISDDAAQKRVSRAVESLRQFFSKQRLAVGAGALVTVISANAVQSAPVGLAATITSVTLTTTSTIGMTMIHKVLIAGMTAAAVGTGIFAFHLQSQVQSLQQQQVGLNNQIAQQQQQLKVASDQLAGLQQQNEQLQADQSDLLRLRNEVTRLRKIQNGLGSATLSKTNNASNPRQIVLDSIIVSIPAEDVQAMGVEWTTSQEGFKTGLLSDSQYKAITEALKGASDATRLSAPRVITLDGMEARFSITSTASVGGTNANAGEDLAVTPCFSTNSSTFNLNFGAKLNLLNGNFSQPDLQTLEITNQAVLSANQTLVLEAEIPSGSWVPNITNLPAATPQSLLVFVTPRIVHFQTRLQQIFR